MQDNRYQCPGDIVNYNYAIKLHVVVNILVNSWKNVDNFYGCSNHVNLHVVLFDLLNCIAKSKMDVLD